MLWASIKVGMTKGDVAHALFVEFHAHRVVHRGFCSYINPMRITFDPVKREKALTERGLDFTDAKLVFEGVTLEIEDIRKEYGE